MTVVLHDRESAAGPQNPRGRTIEGSPFEPVDRLAGGKDVELCVGTG